MRSEISALVVKTIKVVNVKCGGCANTVKTELEKLGIENIKVGFTQNGSAKSRTISFDGDYELVKNKLAKLGYPEVGTEEATSFLKKAKSFISCASGKMK